MSDDIATLTARAEAAERERDALKMELEHAIAKRRWAEMESEQLSERIRTGYHMKLLLATSAKLAKAVEALRDLWHLQHFGCTEAAWHEAWERAEKAIDMAVPDVVSARATLTEICEPKEGTRG